MYQSWYGYQYKSSKLKKILSGLYHYKGGRPESCFLAKIELGRQIKVGFLSEFTKKNLNSNPNSHVTHFTLKSDNSFSDFKPKKLSH